MQHFPKLRGPSPLATGLAALVAANLALLALPGAVTFLAVNAVVLTAALVQVGHGVGVLKRDDSNLLLASVVVALIALYGAFRAFSGLGMVFAHAFTLVPAGLLYLARRLVAFRFAVREALLYADRLGAEARLEFASACRTAFRKELGALTAAAVVFREIAEDALEPGAFVTPVHIKAMQNYAHMLLYGEAKGVRGEGEWYARKAKQLAKAMLRGPGKRQTVH